MKKTPNWKRSAVAALKAWNHALSLSRAWRLRHRMPIGGDVPDLKRFSRIMIWAPHMDDEVIGCGGLMARCAGHGSEIVSVYFTDGACGTSGAERDALMRTRREETRDAARILGVTRCHFLDQPDGALRPSPELGRSLTTLLEQEQPDCLLLPFPLDPHPDHRQLYLLYAALANRWPRLREVFCYQVQVPLPVEEIGFILDISNEWDHKRRALAMYRSQERVPFSVILHLQRCQRYLLGVRPTAVEVYVRLAHPAGLPPEWERRLKNITWEQVKTYREVGRQAVRRRAWM